jgi:hypothetical protein
MAQIKLKTKIDEDFIMEMMSVFEKFEHQGKKYLPYLNTEQKGVISLVDKILSITKSSDHFEDLEKQAKVKEYEKQIGRLVYKLYNLTPEEIEIVENSSK